jgi:hypothetical protein
MNGTGSGGSDSTGGGLADDIGILRLSRFGTME